MDYSTYSEIRREIENGAIVRRLRLSQFAKEPVKIMIGNYHDLKRDIDAWRQNFDLSLIQRRSYLHADFLNLLSRRIYNFLSGVITVRYQIDKHYHRLYEKRLNDYAEHLKEFDESREGQIANGLRAMVVHHWNTPIRSGINEFTGKKPIAIPTKELLDWTQWRNYPVAFAYFKTIDEIPLDILMDDILNKINQFAAWYYYALQEYHKQDLTDYTALVNSIQDYENLEFVSRVSCNLALKDSAFLNAFSEEEFRAFDSVPESDPEGRILKLIQLVRARGVKDELFEQRIREAFTPRPN
jgi:hypothetical protein